MSQHSRFLSRGVLTLNVYYKYIGKKPLSPFVWLLYNCLLYLTIIKKYKNMENKMGSYELVEKVMVDCYGGVLGEYDKEVMDDFYNSFEKGEDVSWEDYNEFCSKYIDDSSEYYYIKLNWKYIVSGGDESVYDEC